MYHKPTLIKKFNMFLEDMFWISYILFIVLAPVVAAGIFIVGLWTTFVA